MEPFADQIRYVRWFRQMPASPAGVIRVCGLLVDCPAWSRIKEWICRTNISSQNFGAKTLQMYARSTLRSVVSSSRSGSDARAGTKGQC